MAYLPRIKPLKKINLPSRFISPTDSNFDLYATYIHMKIRMFCVCTFIFNDTVPPKYFPVC